LFEGYIKLRKFFEFIHLNGLARL